MNALFKFIVPREIGNERPRLLTRGHSPKFAAREGVLGKGRRHLSRRAHSRQGILRAGRRSKQLGVEPLLTRQYQKPLATRGIGHPANGLALPCMIRRAPNLGDAKSGLAKSGRCTHPSQLPRFFSELRRKPNRRDASFGSETTRGRQPVGLLVHPTSSPDGWSRHVRLPCLPIPPISVCRSCHSGNL